MNVVMFYEEVLMDTAHERPIMKGFLLAHSLATQNRLIILTSGEEAKVQHQLRTERLQDQIAEIVDNKVDLPLVPLWQRQLEYVRAKATVDMVITPDPKTAEWLLDQNVLALVFAHPIHVGPTRRPQQGNRSWDDLVKELEARP